MYIYDRFAAVGHIQNLALRLTQPFGFLFIWFMFEYSVLHLYSVLWIRPSDLALRTGSHLNVQVKHMSQIGPKWEQVKPI